MNRNNASSKQLSLINDSLLPTPDSLASTLLSQLTQSYDAERMAIDYNGELADCSAVLIVGLRYCLEREGIADDLQRLWLSALVEVYGKSLVFRDYGNGADAALLAADGKLLAEVVALADRRLKKAFSKLLERRDKSLEQILQQYCERAEKYIKQRNRRSYRQAIKILKELRGICATEERLSDWLGCMAELRSRYGNLRAFVDELDKAGFPASQI